MVLKFYLSQTLAPKDEIRKPEDSDIKLEVNQEIRTKTTIVSSYPPSLIPRLHCIMAKRLLHNNPFLVQNRIKPDSNAPNKDEDKKMDDADFNSNYWNSQFNTFLIDLINDPSLVNNNDYISVIDDTCLSSKAQMNLMKLRKEIISIFQELLLGDNLAAEYLLMHLLSNV
jgi:hypothetical protein